MTSRVAFVMPSLHRVHRGAEVALEAVAERLAATREVTVIGTGASRPDAPYRYVRAKSIPRERFERFPSLPMLRANYQWEELTWIPSLLARYRPDDFDVTIGCTYPFTNWLLRARKRARRRPVHVYVTQNGDWPAYSDKGEYARFGCDGLVCTNPLYFERNHHRWHSALIPNGVDTTRFHPGAATRAQFDLPDDTRVVLMVSALIDSKRVLETMKVVARISDVFFVVAGDGPLRDEFDRLASELMPGRAKRLTLTYADMPALYRSCDVFVHATFLESFGNVYVEALASGVPVVAHDSPATRWIVGEHGVLTDTENDESFLRAMNEALDASGQGAPVRAEYANNQFSWDTIAERYGAFLDDVVDRHVRRHQSR